MKRPEASPPGLGRVLYYCAPDRAESAGGGQTIAETLYFDQMAGAFAVTPSFQGCTTCAIRYSYRES